MLSTKFIHIITNHNIQFSSYTDPKICKALQFWGVVCNNQNSIVVHTTQHAFTYSIFICINSWHKTTKYYLKVIITFLDFWSLSSSVCKLRIRASTSSDSKITDSVLIAELVGYKLWVRCLLTWHKNRSHMHVRLCTIQTSKTFRSIFSCFNIENILKI